MSRKTVLCKKLTVAQPLIQFPAFYRTHQFINIFPTAYHLPESPSHLISSVHPTPFLTHILQCTAALWGTHRPGNLQMPWWYNKLCDKKYQEIMNDRTLNLTNCYWIGKTKSKEPHTMNNTIPNLTIIYYSEKTEE